MMGERGLATLNESHGAGAKHPHHSPALGAWEPPSHWDVHAFILHPKFSSRAPLDISLSFVYPSVPRRNRQGRLGSFCSDPGHPGSDLPVDSQVVLRNLPRLCTQSGGLKSLWIYADLHQQKT